LLPPETEKAWKFLKSQPALAGFVLMGGSALALRLGHRVSEDLDFAWLEEKLPRRRLDAVLRVARSAGLPFERNDHEAALQEFLNGGMELHDYQQDFLVNRAVEVSFFTADASLAKVLDQPREDRVRVATLPELFKSKCLVSAVRSKTRDWLDLYLLLRDHGFTLRQYREAFRQAGISSQADIGLSRLCSGVPQKGDEGCAHLLSNPPSLDEMKCFFEARRDQLEIELAAEARARGKGGG
jgi:hypothetical protein